MSNSTSTLAHGTVLAERYTITNEIGRGGFGTVYRGRQLNIDRDVAIKVLPPKFLTSAEVVERFRREAQLASRLRHPNTITIHDYGRHEDFLFIVMEYLQGEDLADLLRREKKLSVDRIFRIARQALKSLSEAHDNGIVHRDLKPENVFLSVVGGETDFVKVLDFGIAKFASMPDAGDSGAPPARQLTMLGSTVGTPAYMSPEQAAGEEVDMLTDIYALGVIMYEMASGRPPYFGSNPVKIMRSHLFDPIPAFDDAGLKGSLLERIVLKALQKEKPDRFQSAAEFLAALNGDFSKHAPLFTIGKPEVNEIEPPTIEMMASEHDGDPSEPRELSRPNTLSLMAVDAPLFSAKKPESKPRHNTPLSAAGSPPFDAIPFDRAKGKPREPVRQGSSRSGLNDGSDMILLLDEVFEGPPPGLAPDPSSISAILTVLEPAPPEQEIFLLTRPKPIVSEPEKKPANSKIADESVDRAFTTGEYEVRPGTPSATQEAVHSSNAPYSELDASGEHGKLEKWEWASDAHAPDESDDMLASSPGSKLIWVVATLVLLAMAAGYLIWAGHFTL
ncbi:MAG: serine/threonine protein kinase [Bradymonadaceae bacterium]|nr:serine/threonine protein kinase [Lujinxingiaceae bacterium]